VFSTILGHFWHCMYHRLLGHSLSWPVGCEVGMLTDAPTVCTLWIALSATLALVSLRALGHLSIHSPSSDIVLLSWSPTLVAWAIPQNVIRCVCVIMSLPQGHGLLFPLVAWSGHPLVALRYNTFLKVVLDKFFRCPYRLRGMPLYRISS